MFKLIYLQNKCRATVLYQLTKNLKVVKKKSKLIVEI